MLELFITKDFDNIPIVKQGENIFDVKSIKELIGGRIKEIKKENIVLLSGDNFGFIINFFAGVFGGKNIYLVSNQSDLKKLNIDYEILDNNFSDKIKDYNFETPDINYPCINFFTSGSTGNSKLIQKSLFNLISEAKDLTSELGINENFTTFSTTTMCHLFGLTFHLMFSLYNKFVIDTNTVIYPDLSEIQDKNYLLISTPSFLNTFEKYKVKINNSPKYIISSGAKLPDKTFEYLEDFSNIVEIYGSTETGVIARKTKSNGQLKRFSNVEITTQNDKTFIKSNYVFENEIEIFDNLELNNDAVILKNRKDKIVKISDKRISLTEIENRLKENQYIENSFCLKTGEKLGSICSLTEEGKSYLKQFGIIKLQKELKQFLEMEITPQRWRFCDVIPTTQAGKIDNEIVNHIFNTKFSYPVILDRKSEQNKITYTLFFHKNCSFFNGHFDNFQITPGVVQLFLAQEFGEYYFKKNLKNSNVKNMKFKNIIKINSIIDLSLTLDDNKIFYEYKDGEKIFSSGIFLTEEK